MPETIGGVPTHPLMVHGAVVVVPLAVVVAIAVLWKPAWRERYSLGVLVFSALGAGMAMMAKLSGEPMEDHVKDAARAAGAARPRFGEHPEQGDTAFVVALVFLATVAVVWVTTKYGKKFPSWAPMAAYGLVVIGGGAAMVTMIIAGHSGAELVWKDVGNFVASK